MSDPRVLTEDDVDEMVPSVEQSPRQATITDCDR
jgi:hypothetical protein